MPTPNRLPSCTATSALLRRRLPLLPQVAIVLGSGFGPVTRSLANPREFPFRDLPGFPVGAVAGHAGRLLVGDWHGLVVAVLAGRAHFYEGFDLAEVTFPVRVLADLGVSILLLTNAAGGIRRGLRPGDFLALEDDPNFLGNNPLRGPVPPGRDRFVDLSAVYDPELRRWLKQAARRAGVRLHEGVYLAISGPSYETPAEIRAFRRLGADAVGMSTVPEAIVARQCGLRVAALSCITNLAAGLGAPGHQLSHTEVLATSERARQDAVTLVDAFVERCARSLRPAGAGQT